MRRFASLLVIALAGCSTSHAPGDCSGDAPSCYPGWSGMSWCCLDMPVDASCVEGAWVCGGGRFQATECGWIDWRCEGPRDAGVDARPPPPDYSACSVPSECALASTTCCGTCGRPSLTDFEAINGLWYEEYYYDVACPDARVAPPPCPECVSEPNPNLVAICTAGRCEGLDIENDPRFSECASDADCVLRVPECCDCGADTSSYNLVALRSTAIEAYLAAVCGPAESCDACLPTYPTDVVAQCASGFCRGVPVGDI